jgi:hypothetical protein
MKVPLELLRTVENNNCRQFPQSVSRRGLMLSIKMLECFVRFGRNPSYATN